MKPTKSRRFNDFDRYVLAELPRNRAPRRYLTDTRRHVGADPTTAELSRARIWLERSGAQKLLRRIPSLQDRFYVLPMMLDQLRAATGRRRKAG